MCYPDLANEHPRQAEEFERLIAEGHSTSIQRELKSCRTLTQFSKSRLSSKVRSFLNQRKPNAYLVEIWIREDGNVVCSECHRTRIPCIRALGSTRATECQPCRDRSSHRYKCSRVKAYKEWLLDCLLSVSRTRASKLIYWTDTLLTSSQESRTRVRRVKVLDPAPDSSRRRSPSMSVESQDASQSELESARGTASSAHRFPAAETTYASPPVTPSQTPTIDSLLSEDDDANWESVKNTQLIPPLPLTSWVGSFSIGTLGQLVSAAHLLGSSDDADHGGMPSSENIGPSPGRELSRSLHFSLDVRASPGSAISSTMPVQTSTSVSDTLCQRDQNEARQELDLLADLVSEKDQELHALKEALERTKAQASELTQAFTDVRSRLKVLEDENATLREADARHRLMRERLNDVLVNG